MDWPSKPGLTVAEQKAELISLMDRAAGLKLNAVILQVRPAADALYASQLEPWSEYLAGRMGQAPLPFYDPLAFAVEEAHRRGLELHAWFNPFRARHLSSKSAVASNHLSRSHPNIVRKYGKHLLWLDPAEKLAQQHSTAVILDVVKRYDIDGVHLDDYFYPYPEKGADGKFIEFPDDVSWRRYRNAGGKLNRGDWRRKNVDDFIQNLYRRIKAEKAWVKFGVSPFGIWRPGNPPSIVGLDAYESLFADSRKWLANGWADYFAPQLYWSIEPAAQSYPVLLKWWTEQNLRGRHVWPGNNAANVGKNWRADEIVRQVEVTRHQSGAPGNIFWNASAVLQNADLRGSLTRLYAQPALVPASAWLDSKPPSKPDLLLSSNDGRSVKLAWKSIGDEATWLWVLQTKINGTWSTMILPRKETTRTFTATPALPEWAALSAVDRCGNTSAIAILDLRPRKN